MIDLIGKKLYLGSNLVQKAFLGDNRFYGSSPAIEPGAFAIPGLYGNDMTSSSVINIDTIGYSRNSSTGKYTNFQTLLMKPFGVMGASPNLLFYQIVNSSVMTKSGGTIPVGATSGAIFKPYTVEVAGNYVLKYDAKCFAGETNAGYFSKSLEKSDDIGTYQTYTTEWQTYYEPPVYMSIAALSRNVHYFFMRLQREPGSKGRVQFTNFELIPAELLT